MANVPGVVTDPSRIKGGVISLQSGGAQIPAYMARPNQPGNYPGIVVIQEAGAGLRQYRLQRLRTGSLLAARRTQGPGRHGNGVSGHVRLARQ